MDFVAAKRKLDTLIEQKRDELVSLEAKRIQLDEMAKTFSILLDSLPSPKQNQEESTGMASEAAAAADDTETEDEKELMERKREFEVELQHEANYKEDVTPEKVLYFTSFRLKSPQNPPKKRARRKRIFSDFVPEDDPMVKRKDDAFLC